MICTIAKLVKLLTAQLTHHVIRGHICLRAISREHCYRNSHDGAIFQLEQVDDRLYLSKLCKSD